MMLRKRVLVTGGAGFLGSHLCERLLAAGHEVLCVDNFFTGTKRNVAHLLGQSALRADAPRRDLPALCRGRRDLQPRLPGLADPLPARSGADDQDLACTAPSTCWAWPSGCRRKIFQASTSRGLRRPARSTRRPRTTGATSTRSARAPATTRASAAPRPCSSTTTASTSCDIKVARIFNTYGPRMHPNDGRVVSNFIVQALKGEPITIYGDGTQTRSFCYVDDLIEGFIRLMDDRRRGHRPDQSRQSRRVHHPSAGREGHRAGPAAKSKLVFEPAAARTIRSSASPTSRWPASIWAGSPRSR